MNAKQLIAASVLAVIGTGAFAGEATEFVDPPSTLSRAAVVSETRQAAARGEVYGFHEADLRAQPSTIGIAVRPRTEVRAEARSTTRGHYYVHTLYVGA